LAENEINAEMLFDLIKTLLADYDRRKAMSDAALGMAVFDAKERIYDVITEAVQRKPEK
jgi:UDP-N-acetylglucosamine:LPS N-acetylglucosamine transferase